MSKYDPLWKYIVDNNKLEMTYDEIKDVLGFEIDHSFLTYKKELVPMGYMVDKISMKNKIVKFKRVEL